MESKQQLDRGRQPLDQLMEQVGVANADLVRASTEHLTHKQVAKSRRGRTVTRNIQMKILRALAACCPEQDLALGDLFNYRGKL